MRDWLRSRSQKIPKGPTTKVDLAVREEITKSRGPAAVGVNSGHGNVWLNPPYARGLIEAFAEKLVYEYTNGRCRQAIVLVDNRTATC
jgi:hypothetical protein